MARKIKSLQELDGGYPHREHRSKGRRKRNTFNIKKTLLETKEERRNERAILEEWRTLNSKISLPVS